MNSCNFFVSKLEEMKSCIYCIKTVFAWVRLWGRWYHLLVKVIEKTVSFTSKRVCRIQFVSEICNHDPMFTRPITGLRVDKCKSLNIKRWNIVWGEQTEVPKFEGYDQKFAAEQNYQFLHILFNNNKLVNCNRRYSFTHYNEFSNVFKRLAKI